MRSHPSCNLSCVAGAKLDVAHHNDRPPTGTFQRLGMKTQRSNKSSKFENLETHALSPIQTSPPDKVSANSGMEVLTPSPRYVNHPAALPTSKATQRLHLNYDPSRRNLTAKAGYIETPVDSDGEQETVFGTGPDSVFYADGPVEGDCRTQRDVSKLSQVRILASPPPTGKLPDSLMTKTPGNAKKSWRPGESMSCQPHIRSSLRRQGQARDSVQSEGSRKSRRSLLSRKLRLGSQDRKPRNSKDTQYSPLINENPTNTEDSSTISGEDQPLQKHDIKPTHEDTQRAESDVEEVANQNEFDKQKSSGLVRQDVSLVKSIEKGVGLLMDIGTGVINPGYEKNPVASMSWMNINNMSSDIKKNIKRGSPGNTGNEISLPHHLIDIDIDGPQPFEPTDNPMVSSCDSYQLGTSNSHIVAEVKGDFGGETRSQDNIQNELSREVHVTNSSPHPRQTLGTKPKVRTSSSARKERATYLGKRPGVTESDITSQSEDDRPGSRLSSLRRNHLSVISQSEEDDVTDQKQRYNVLTSASPSQSPQYSVLTSNNVDERQGNKSNYPPNSWESNQHSANNFQPSSWDPMIINQQFESQLTERPLNLSSSSGQVNLSNSGPHHNLSVTAMDNSTLAEGNHTSSPHSSAHLSVFNPVDMSIPGLNPSFQLSPNQDNLVGETSPPLQQVGRYN